MNGQLHTEWTDRLSAYLDGELEPADREGLEAHLAVCPACRAVHEDLRRIVAAAPGYEGDAPSRDLWPGIAAGIEQRRHARLPAGRVPRGARRFSLGQLAAAAAVFAVLGGAGVWVALESRGARPGAGESVARAPREESLVMPVRATEAYDAAVRDLEQVLAEGRGRLDTATVRILEENLALIDRAIAEAWDAVLADPGDTYLQRRIAANMHQKLDILRRAADAVLAL
jgi:anti-sigma factor RsiW